MVALDLDFADLQRSDVKFMKVAADLLIEQLLDADAASALPSLRDISAADFSGLTRRYGIELIAEKCESERQIVDILELDVGMGQGHLFGEPRGDWLGFDTTVSFGSGGLGVTSSVLHDEDGPFGVLAQALTLRELPAAG